MTSCKYSYQNQEHRRVCEHILEVGQQATRLPKATIRTIPTKEVVELIKTLTMRRRAINSSVEL